MLTLIDEKRVFEIQTETKMKFTFVVKSAEDKSRWVNALSKFVTEQSPVTEPKVKRSPTVDTDEMDKLRSELDSVKKAKTQEIAFMNETVQQMQSAIYGLTNDKKELVEQIQTMQADRTASSLEKRQLELTIKEAKLKFQAEHDMLALKQEELKNQRALLETEVKQLVQQLR
jgi:hypothetical protein